MAEAVKHGVRAEAFRTDLRQPGDIQALVEGTFRAFGRIDVLVNNIALGKIIKVVGVPYGHRACAAAPGSAG